MAKDSTKVTANSANQTNQEEQELQILTPTNANDVIHNRILPTQFNPKFILAIVISLILLCSLIATFLNPKVNTNEKLDASINTLYKLTSLLSHGNIGAITNDNGQIRFGNYSFT